MSDEMVQLGIEITAGGAKVTASTQIVLAELAGRLKSMTSALVAEAATIRELAALSPTPLPAGGATMPASPAGTLVNDDVWGRLAANIGVDRSKLIGNRIFGFKGTSPQILNPSAFKTPNAAFRALAYINEVGNSVKEAAFGVLSELADTSRIKGAALTTIVNDLKKTGMIDPKRYDDAKMIALTPKGESTARNEVRYLLDPPSS